ncbi:protein ABHD8 [Trichomycterus rosablanca]|uniref:protein ABHD8 n=1 Tax=Trichomycterus rosablanca TaxID=2290929 RepID=UPI002F357739
MTMLTSLIDGVLSCLTGTSTNTVVPIQNSEPTDGFEFVEVKPGRVLRVRHIIPDRAVVDEPDKREAGSINCKRKITMYPNGQLFIENVSEATHPELIRCQNGESPVEASDNNNRDSRKVESSMMPQEQVQHRRRKPKHTVMIDCERKITCCKETHPDVALFFIHGVGGSLEIWENQMNYFSQLGYEVIAPDLAGHGASSAPQIAAAYTFYALADDVRIIFMRYAKQRNILIGHSYGVSFCTFLAHEYPDQVHKVVMINGGGPTALEPSLCSVFNLPTCVLHCLSPCLSWSFLMAGFAHPSMEEKKLLKEKNAFNVSSFVLRAMMSGQYWPEGDEIYHAELTVPTLLVHGMHDKFVSIHEDQRMAEILMLGFLKVINEGSHMVMMECPETVNTLLHEFFLWQPASASKPKEEPALSQNANRSKASKEAASATITSKTTNSKLEQDYRKQATAPKPGT